MDFPKDNYLALLASIAYNLSAEKALSYSGLIERDALKGSRKGRKTWTNDEMLDALEKKADSISRTPTIDDLNGDPELPSGPLYVKRFGSYSKACELVYLKPNIKGRRSICE